MRSLIAALLLGSSLMALIPTLTLSIKVLMKPLWETNLDTMLYINTANIETTNEKLAQWNKN
jgi:hypothetical protein